MDHRVRERDVLTLMPNAQEIKDWLNLQPNPQEGGFFASVYNSPITIPNDVLPGFRRVKTKRSICGSIHYFLESPGFSAMHRVTGDMLYHFYAGDSVQMLLLPPKGGAEVVIFGNNLALHQSPMKLIAGKTWLGSRLTQGGTWALMGVSMAPGFNPQDYSIGNRDSLVQRYPEQADLIRALTRAPQNQAAQNA